MSSAGRDERFFIEAPSDSDDDEEARSISRMDGRVKEEAAHHGDGGSSPIILAFSEHRSSMIQSCSDSMEEEDCEQSIEDWMILGQGEEEGDSCIQLNISYRNSSEEDSDNEGLSEDPWVVSEMDKNPSGQHLRGRYFMPDHLSTLCSRPKTSYLTRTLQIKKSPTCVLCGLQGHFQRTCPSRPCLSCGLPAHGLKACDSPPVWHQYCQRCGMTGHLADVCPDTWRQYHLTVRPEVPLRPVAGDARRHSKRQCYNCSERGHYGHECSKRRMMSGTFPTVPYVCLYDTLEDVLLRLSRMHKRQKELSNSGKSSDHLSDETGQSEEDNLGRSRRSKRTWSSQRKTWPDRRRERQEVKRLRREAQARRQGGLLLRAQMYPNEDDFTSCSFKTKEQEAKSPKRKEDGGDKNRRRSGERWAKSRRIKRGDLYSCSNHEINGRNLVSLKQRVRHRRR
ncbi:zinc finger CCHC domain-containing protein 7-like [Synchiropus splendidus]|uniref:zinc finger CCHC domain-containing protein 7-like n=1 Tax=Synchiropus splendidus TaxID=270530 RepID=UPI00237D64B8|nr:zinc finger CCHC domain-containing protein 7-like [Synchiropus splendidus]